jgi:hypothetical protein
MPGQMKLGIIGLGIGQSSSRLQIFYFLFGISTMPKIQAASPAIIVPLLGNI